jgi:hypothetical protein
MSTERRSDGLKWRSEAFAGAGVACGILFCDRDFPTASEPLLGFPSEGCEAGARLAEQTRFAPNTETFSAVHNISVVCLTRLARSPGGLGGRSRIEFIMSPLPRRRHNESHFAAQSPERFLFPSFSFSEKEKEVISGDEVTKSKSNNPQTKKQIFLNPLCLQKTRQSKPK